MAPRREHRPFPGSAASEVVLTWMITPTAWTRSGSPPARRAAATVPAAIRLAMDCRLRLERSRSVDMPTRRS